MQPERARGMNQFNTGAQGHVAATDSHADHRDRRKTGSLGQVCTLGRLLCNRVKSLQGMPGSLIQCMWCYTKMSRTSLYRTGFPGGTCITAWILGYNNCLGYALLLNWY